MMSRISDLGPFTENLKNHCTIEQAINASKLDRIEKYCLMTAATGFNKTFLVVNHDQRLKADQLSNYVKLTHRRFKGEPIAYLVGKREFFGIELEVNRSVLIPRPETETLVGFALSKLQKDIGLSVLDLGTGSGAVAIAVAVNRKNVNVVAIDKFQPALNVARRNAKRYIHDDRISFLASDWYAALENDTKFDMILANPPYICPRDPHLLAPDLQYEPSHALVASDNGIQSIRQIVTGAPQFLRRKSWLMLEHGYDQSKKTLEILKNTGFSALVSEKDLAGHRRVSGGLWDH